MQAQHYHDGTEHTRLVIALCFFIGAILASLLFGCTPTPTPPSPTVSPLPTWSPISPPPTPEARLWQPHSLL